MITTTRMPRIPRVCVADDQDCERAAFTGAFVTHRDIVLLRAKFRRYRNTKSASASAREFVPCISGEE
jgi:hypothetical protein